LVEPLRRTLYENRELNEHEAQLSKFAAPIFSLD
jgi:hypothetical protein